MERNPIENILNEMIDKILADIISSDLPLREKLFITITRGYEKDIVTSNEKEVDKMVCSLLCDRVLLDKIEALEHKVNNLTVTLNAHSADDLK